MSPPVTPRYRILLLEDEVIISDTIARHLQRAGHQVVATPITYEEAVAAYAAHEPEVAILDIRLRGNKSGIDFAHFLREQSRPIPYIFLTSQTDTHYISGVKQTFPAGYLSKPVQVGSLLATLEVAMHNHRAQHDPGNRTVILRDGRQTHRIRVTEVEYVQASHVYVHLHLANKPPLMLRMTLGELIDELGRDLFLMTHRSYAVNVARISRYERGQVWVGETALPVSRGRRSEVHQRLSDLPGSGR